MYLESCDSFNQHKGIFLWPFKMLKVHIYYCKRFKYYPDQVWGVIIWKWLYSVETEPFCEDSISTEANVTLEEGDDVWMRCSVNFRGNLTPIMEWRQFGRSGETDERDDVINGVVEINPDGNINSTLTLVIKSTYNATFFTCRTYFQLDNTSSTNSTAINAPIYSYTWNSSVILISAKTFVQTEIAAVSESTSNVTSTTRNISRKQKLQDNSFYRLIILENYLWGIHVL